MTNNLETKIEPLKVMIPKLVFWLKPAGEDFCKGLLREDESYICMKSASMLTRRYPIDCKYLERNYDYPDLSSCSYNKK